MFGDENFKKVIQVKEVIRLGLWPHRISVIIGRDTKIPEGWLTLSSCVHAPRAGHGATQQELSPEAGHAGTLISHLLPPEL